MTRDEVREALTETNRDAKERSSALRQRATDLRERAHEVIRRSEFLRARTERTVDETRQAVYTWYSPDCGTRPRADGKLTPPGLSTLPGATDVA